MTSELHRSRSTGLLLENKDGKLLFQLRDNNPKIPYADCWGTFGGHIEAGETPEQAIIREVKEELGYTLVNPTLMQRFDINDPKHQQPIEIFIFHQKDPAVTLEDLKVNEGQAAAFFSPEEVLKLPCYAGVQEIVTAYQAWKKRGLT